MVHRGEGAIITISSDSVYMIIPKNAVYTGAKSFLKSFTEGLHLDLMGTGVKVMAVCPGLPHTDFYEKGKGNLYTWKAYEVPYSFTE